MSVCPALKGIEQLQKTISSPFELNKDIDKVIYILLPSAVNCLGCDNRLAMNAAGEAIDCFIEISTKENFLKVIILFPFFFFFQIKHRNFFFFFL
mgnify:CR=1 FL=1